MDIKIAIPSYNRVDNITKKTLAFLSRYNYPKELIYIFVHSEEQKEEYETKLPKELYGHIISTNQPKGIMNVRNYVVDYFDEDDKFISMDDDLITINRINEGKLCPIDNFNEVIEKGFQLCEEHGYTLWGLYPTANAFYMKSKNEYTIDLRFISGGFMGIINKKRHVHLNWKEDYELSIQAYNQDGGVIRFNHIAVKSDLYTKTGGIGLNQKERMDDYKEAGEWLINKYPSLVKWNPRREGEILLNSRTKKTKNVKEVNYKICDIIDKNIFKHLEDLLSKWCVPFKSEAGIGDWGTTTNGRRGFPKHRGTIFGYCKRRIGHTIGLSYNSKKRPDIYEEIVKIGKLICPFEFTSIQINNNLVCPKHFDSNNVGESMLVSFGNYEGGSININVNTNTIKHDAKYHPIIFNGSLLEHWNDEIISGNKYSLVFFSIKKLKDFQQLKDDFKQMMEEQGVHIKDL